MCGIVALNTPFFKRLLPRSISLRPRAEPILPVSVEKPSGKRATRSGRSAAKASGQAADKPPAPAKSSHAYSPAPEEGKADEELPGSPCKPPRGKGGRVTAGVKAGVQEGLAKG
eukprot:5053892-Prymnesium_polylepis.1